MLSRLAARTKAKAAALMTAALCSAIASSAHGTIVERVVAVVGERPVLLTDLRKRARPYVYQIYSSSPNEAQRAAQESEMYRELLNRMIDERLQDQAADKARLAVTAEEVDRGLKNKAASLGLTVKDLLAEAKRQGLVEADYRDEVRRQLLEGKLIQLRVMSRVRVSEDDARNEYARWVGQLTNTLFVEPLMIARPIAGMGDTEVKEELRLAAEAVQKARSGTPYCKVVEQYSKDVQTKNVCGSRGLQPMTALFPELEAAVKALRPGEISDPIVIAGQAVLVVSITKAPRIPAFEEVREQMQERAMGQVIDRQRKLWLEELRRGIYIDVRL